jgi:uroporphyrinogen-III decarboxylase
VNSTERLIKRLKGEAVDRPPNFDIFMTYAAHYIKQPLSKYYRIFGYYVTRIMQCWKLLNLDIVQAISDSYREAADFGLEVEFPFVDLHQSKKPLIVELEDINKLKKRS